MLPKVIQGQSVLFEGDKFVGSIDPSSLAFARGATWSGDVGRARLEAGKGKLPDIKLEDSIDNLVAHSTTFTEERQAYPCFNGQDGRRR